MNWRTNDLKAIALAMARDDGWHDDDIALVEEAADTIDRLHKERDEARRERDDAREAASKIALQKCRPEDMENLLDRWPWL